MLPDANTDVCINKGKLNYPLLNFSQFVESISQQSGTKIALGYFIISISVITPFYKIVLFLKN